jgi:hypothetical protein
LNSLAKPSLRVRVLLDENLPLDLAKSLPGHEVTTVHALGGVVVVHAKLNRLADLLAHAGA